MPVLKALQPSVTKDFNLALCLVKHDLESDRGYMEGIDKVLWDGDAELALFNHVHKLNCRVHFLFSTIDVIRYWSLKSLKQEI
jgi:hypothetical protein